MSKRNSILTYEIALPNGEKRLHRSSRAYTHAVVGYDPRYQDWGVIGVCGSKKLAEKRLASWRRLSPKTPSEIVVINVSRTPSQPGDILPTAGSGHTGPASLASLEGPCAQCEAIAIADGDILPPACLDHGGTGLVVPRAP